MITAASIFVLLFVSAMLLFLTSFHTLTDMHGDHLTVMSNSKLAPRAAMVSTAGKSSSSSSSAAATTTERVKVGNSNNGIDKNLKIMKGKSESTVSIENSETKAAQSNSDKSVCKLAFPTKTCKINPYIKYWDDNAECFSSPLRASSGSAVKLEDRKYVVFQPDLGGWNNIRMALEVVIVFALVTGRILVMPPDAILYLLHMNKKWGENKSNMDDFMDFKRLMKSGGLEVISIEDFLSHVYHSTIS